MMHGYSERRMIPQNASNKNCDKTAQDTLVGIELMHMIKKKQIVLEAGDEGLTAAELFYSLAA